MATTHGALPANAKRVAGVVAVDALGMNYSVAAGSGFTVARQLAGVIRVTFTTAFLAPPIVVACPVYDTGAGGFSGRQSCQVTNRTTTSVDIRVLDSSGALTDGEFTFIAEEAS